MCLELGLIHIVGEEDVEEGVEGNYPRLVICLLDKPIQLRIETYAHLVARPKSPFQIVHVDLRDPVFHPVFVHRFPR